MNDLIAQLVQQLGVQPEQAAGGAGLIFKLAQQQMGGDFTKLAQAVPGVGELMKAAPAEGGAAKMLGGLASALGGHAGELAGLGALATSFSKLNLDPAMVGKFLPVVISFVRSKAGPEIGQLLGHALK
jgi:Protein of unknown function VcgC/VcgE (DUF2780)